MYDNRSCLKGLARRTMAEGGFLIKWNIWKKKK